MLRSWRLWVLLGIGLAIVLAIIVSFFGRSSSEEQLSLSDVITLARQGEVRLIEVDGNRLTVHTTDGAEFTSHIEDNASIIDILASNDVALGTPEGLEVEIHSDSTLSVYGVLFLLAAVLPAIALTILLVAAAYWVYRRARATGSGA